MSASGGSRPGSGGGVPGWYGSGATKRSAARAEGRATADAAWMIVGHLLAGIVLYAGIGWLLSLWLGHRSLFIAGGALVGLGLSMYLVFTRLGLLSDPQGDDGPERT